MAPFIWPSLMLLATSLSSSSSKHYETAVEVEVCLSPGCLGDGASSTLSRLKAYAHPSICVREGSCQSLCGKGPILIQNPDGDGSKKRGRKVLLKFMKDDKKLIPFLEGLLEEGEKDETNRNCIPDALIEGYNLIDRGFHALDQKSFTEASQLLKAGIDKALQPAKIYGSDMEWITRAYRSLAESLVGQSTSTDDNDNGNLYNSAMEFLEKALVINPEDETSYALLATIHKARKDPDGEYEALVAMFALPCMSRDSVSVSPRPTREIENRRRDLGFRLQKLKQELQREWE